MFVVVEINLHVAIQKNLSSNHTKASRCGVVSAVWLATWLYAAPERIIADHRCMAYGPVDIPRSCCLNGITSSQETSGCH